MAMGCSPPREDQEPAGDCWPARYFMEPLRSFSVAASTMTLSSLALPAGWVAARAPGEPVAGAAVGSAGLAGVAAGAGAAAGFAGAAGFVCAPASVHAS